MHRWTRRAFLAAAASLAGCARLERPPLGEIYRAIPQDAGHPPLVLIPGTFGSCLRDRRSGRQVWPGSAVDLLTSDYRGLELEIDPDTLEPRADDIEAYDLFEQGLGRDFYGRILRTLERAGGYARSRVGESPRPDRRNFFVYAYDFRLDNVRAVRGLHELIERIRADYGDPALRVDVLAHSSGGLLARYYARYGTAELPEGGAFAPTGAGAAAMRRLLLVGTPNLGTLQPVLSHVRGEELGLRRIPQEVLATCTGIPQMMTHPAVPWLVDAHGRVLREDVFDLETWRRLGWSLFDPRVAERAIAHHGGGTPGRRYLDALREYLAKHLRRGRRFLESLAAPAPGSEPPLFVFGGDCELTLARIVVERDGGSFVAREKVEDVAAAVPGLDYSQLMFDPGDGVVTRSSLLGRGGRDIGAPLAQIDPLPVAHSVFLCEQHHQLTGNRSFQDNLLYALLGDEPV